MFLKEPTKVFNNIHKYKGAGTAEEPGSIYKYKGAETAEEPGSIYKYKGAETAEEPGSIYKCKDTETSIKTWQRMSILEKQGPTYISITASVRHIAHHSDQTR